MQERRSRPSVLGFTRPKVGGFAMRSGAGRVQSRPIEWPELPAEIVDRDADVWEPLIAIADLIRGKWPDRAREARVALIAASKEVEPGLGIELLNDFRVVFGVANEIFSKTILQALHGRDEAPWADLRGKPLDDWPVGCGNTALNRRQ
jgi:hypothetical protein